MKNSLTKFIKKTSKLQRIALAAVIMVVIGAVASVSYMTIKAAESDNGQIFTTKDGKWSYVWDKLNDYQVTIVHYNGTDKNITFPAPNSYKHYDNGKEYDPLDFKAIGRYLNDWSDFCTKIQDSEVTSITIPEGYTDIGGKWDTYNKGAFINFTSLTTVKLPSTLTYLGSASFKGCTSLATINLPNGLTFLGAEAFYGCSSLKSIVLPDSLTAVGANNSYTSGTSNYGGAFRGCTSLESVTLPSNLKSIECYTFSGCTALKSIELPSGLTSIGYDAFSYSGLESINLPGLCTSIESNAFAGTNLKSVILPYGMTEISYGILRDCKQLVNVVIPTSVKRIRGSAFAGCSSLENMKIPNTVTEVEGSVFRECSALRSVSLPKGIKKISESTFFNCPSLMDVYNIQDVTEIGDDAFRGCGNLFIPHGSFDNVTKLGERAFQNSHIYIDNYLLPNLQEVSKQAFAYAWIDGSFTIPSGVTSLPEHLFMGSKVKELIIPETVTSVSQYALDLDGVENLVWDTTASIPNYLCRFRHQVGSKPQWSYGINDENTTLKTVTIKKDIKRIGENAFRHCVNLTYVQAKNVGQVSKQAFYGCTNLWGIDNLISSAQSIGEQAFYQCGKDADEGIGKVTLNANLSGVGKEAFAYSGISELDAGNISCTINEGTFSNCVNLTKVDCWNASRFNSNDMFKNCTNLNEFTFGSNYTEFPYLNGLFSGCTNLKDVYVKRTTNLNQAISSNLFSNKYGITTTIHYYAPSSGTNPWQSYYNSYGNSQKFTLEPIAEPPKTVSSIKINSADGNPAVGKTVKYTATITYADGTIAEATPENSYWKSNNVNRFTVDNNGNVTGVGSGSANLYIYSKETSNVSTSVGITIEPAGGGEVTDIPAQSVKITDFVVNYNTEIKKREYESGVKPFALVQKGYCEFYFRSEIRPANTTDEPKVEITKGDDIIAFRYDYGNTESAYRCYNANFHTLSNEAEGDITVKITCGDYSDEFSFTLKRYEGEGQNLKGVWFDDASQAKKNVLMGQSYTYTAFPTEWWGGNPYMWYEVKYELSDPQMADLSVDIVDDGAVDGSGNKYQARVATVTPKKAGQVKLRAYPAGLSGWYQELTLNITDPTGAPPIPPEPPKRPDDSGDPNVIWATSVTFPNNTITVAVGKTFTMNPLIKPANCNDDLTFYSYNSNIAGVNGDTGVITGGSVGETTVGVTTSSGLNAEMKVIVVEAEVPTTDITIPDTFSMKVGAVRALSFSRTPENATDNVTWTSSNEDAVKVSGGNLTAVAEGTAIITVTSGNITKTCTVTVTKGATGIMLNSDSAKMKRGETLQLTATLLPAGVSDDVTWTSSNTKIATVSKDGEVKAVGYGDVTITAQTDNASAECTIFVEPNLDFKILGASIRMSNPYGIRFGIQLGKTGDFGKVKIVEYGTVMKPTQQLGSDDLTLYTPNVLRVKGEVIYSETSAARVYTGVLINIPKSFFGTDVSGRGYLIYEDTNGVQHTIYTDIVSRSFIGVAQSAYESYSKITNPNAAQKEILKKLEEILASN